MKSGTVYYRDIPAGTLVKDADGYLFRYDPLYFADSAMRVVGLTSTSRDMIPASCPTIALKD